MNQADYIVIGAGSAGCIVASNLAARNIGSVLLIEAGSSHYNPLFRMPAMVKYAMHYPSLIWRFYTQPQEKLAKKIYWPRGRGVGGCSRINAMCAVQPTETDIEDWQEYSDSRWNYDAMMRSISMLKMPLTPTQQIHAISQDFLSTLSQIGVDIELITSAKNPCAGPFFLHLNNNERVIVSDVYLENIPENLNMISHTIVQRLIFSGDRVLGVECQNKKTFTARKKVILCLGALQTPELLLRSKLPIGLPGIGKNLQDHLCVLLPVKTHHHNTLNLSYFQLLKAGFHYFFTHQGSGASIGAEVCAFVKSVSSKVHPDIQIYCIPAYLGKDARIEKTHGFTLNVCLLKPHSRGYLNLGSSNTVGDLNIYPNYLYDEKDLENLIEGICVAQKILLQEPLSQHLSLQEQMRIKNWGRDDIKKMIYENSQSNYHPVGTCRMGNDNMSVVDSSLKVHGIQNLYIADASVIPVIPAANPQMTVMGLAQLFSVIED